MPTFHPSTRSPGTLVAVALGGALGTVSRYVLERALPAPPTHFPTTTLIINLSGSLVIGLLVPHGLAGRAPPLPRPFWWSASWVAGPPISTLAVEAARSSRAPTRPRPRRTSAATLFGGLALVAVGLTPDPPNAAIRSSTAAPRSLVHDATPTPPPRPRPPGRRRRRLGAMARALLIHDAMAHRIRSTCRSAP